MSKEDTYLGDGLYASNDGYQIRLYATNGCAVSNEVFLEPEVYRALVAYASSLGIYSGITPATEKLVEK